VKILKYVICVKICHEAKLQALVRIQMTRHQPSTFQNRIFRELNKVTLAERWQNCHQSFKYDRQTT